MSRHVSYCVHRRHLSVLKDGSRTPGIPSKSLNHLEIEQVVRQVLQVQILATINPIPRTCGIEGWNLSRPHQDRSYH